MRLTLTAGNLARPEGFDFSAINYFAVVAAGLAHMGAAAVSVRSAIDPYNPTPVAHSQRARS